jgi:repressor LexA
MGADVPFDNKPNTIPAGFQPIPTTNKKPRLGVISCGNPIDTPENFDGYDDVPDMFDCDFTLICEGDSMMGARICDGDIVYIKQQPTIENGQIAAVLIDGDEKLLKRVYITDESIILQAENPAYPPRSYHREDMNRVSIIGKVVGFTSMVK